MALARFGVTAAFSGGRRALGVAAQVHRHPVTAHGPVEAPPRHAMKVLRERGLIITRQGRGTFVAPWPAAMTAATADERG